MQHGLLRHSKIIEVIFTEVVEGDGTQENPFREVRYYHDRYGTLIFRDDPKALS